AANIVRGPVDPATPNLPGPIVSILEINQNLGKLRASGFDVDLRATSSPSRWGRVSAQITGSHLDNWAVAFDGVNAVSVAGTYFGASFPRWQHTLTLGWDRKPWSASLVQSWREGYVDERTGLDGNPRRVSPYRTWDAQIAYGDDRAGLRFAAGVKNVFNRPPPVSNQSDTFQVGYDPTYADPRGRGYYLRVVYGWH
nr:TonB-dependent receptor [Pseudomonadota bacterium]